MHERREPSCCAACESRTLRKHCESGACRWAVCQKCHATTGIIGKWDGGKWVGWKRVSFGWPKAS